LPFRREHANLSGGAEPPLGAPMMYDAAQMVRMPRFGIYSDENVTIKLTHYVCREHTDCEGGVELRER